MKKTTLFLTEQQWTQLQKITLETGIKFSELIRRGIDKILKEYER